EHAEREERKEYARLQHDAEIRRLARVENRAEPVAEAGIDGGRRDDADEGRADVGREPDAEKGGNEVDEPERERDEAQEEKIVEGIAAEPVLELARERTGAAAQHVAERGPRDEEDGRRAERRT